MSNIFMIFAIRIFYTIVLLSSPLLRCCFTLLFTSLVNCLLCFFCALLDDVIS